MLKIGDSGQAVVNLQKNLAQLGYKMEFDGEFGEKTELAVADFQESHEISPDGIVGPVTEKKIAEALLSQLPGKIPWLEFLKRHLGEHEVEGKKANPFILSLFKHTSFKTNSDETPWCGATACSALEESGFESTKSASAISFVDCGEPCELKPGAIVVLEFADKSHHVTFCDHIINDLIFAGIGGNQADSIKISNFKKSEIIAIRWPKPLPGGELKVIEAGPAQVAEKVKKPVKVKAQIVE